MEKVEYIRCPRCELNYIKKKDKLCSVCKAEIASLGKHDELDNMQICPICKSNYINENEDMCSYCAEEKSYEDNLGGNLDRDESWRMYVQNEDGENEDEIDEMCIMNDEEDQDELDTPELDLDDIDEDEDLEDLDDEELEDLDDDEFDEFEDDLDDDIDDDENDNEEDDDF